MTTTPNYIRKCEMAEEIQAMRAPIKIESVSTDDREFSFEYGDFFSFKLDCEYRTIVLGNTLTKPAIYENGQSFVGFDQKSLKRNQLCIYSVVVWLPRLDQLLDISDGMSLSLNEAETILGENREEKFLDVLMRNKFGKKWDGEKWVAV